MSSNHRKGIILAGGIGTRLYPLTKSISKQLLPVFDKPLLYYPISTLMLAGVRDILIIVDPKQQNLFESLCGDGSQWGLNIVYATQAGPNGIPEAYIIAEKFLGESCSLMILGDNIFHSHGLGSRLNQISNSRKNTILLSRVSDPSSFGVANLDQNGKLLEIEEKPSKPKSDLAVTGIYFFDERAPHLAKSLAPSGRGELEIVDLMRLYLQEEALDYEVLQRGVYWADSGTITSINQASNFVESLQSRTGLLICSPEEIAVRSGFITFKQFENQIARMPESSYKHVLIEALSGTEVSH